MSDNKDKWIYESPDGGNTIFRREFNKYGDRELVSKDSKSSVKDIIREAIKILGMYDRNCKISMGMAMSNTRKFLRDNFDLHDSGDRSDEWRIKQFNRNRDSSEWVHTIKELEDRIDKIFKD